MQPVALNNWIVATDNRIGPWSVITSEPVSLEQKLNANIVRSFFINEGWTLEAICGMLGCMQGESTINPAYIEQTNRWRLPNSAADLTDVPNSIMKNFHKEYYAVTSRGFAIGLVQWDGYTNVNLPGGITEQQQKLVAFAIRNNIIWYDGWTQLYRLRGEWQYDVTHGTNTFFKRVRYSGVWYDFNNYPTSTESPETLAAAWTAGYERNAGGVGYRDDNARWWYNWFTGEEAPEIIPPEDFMQPLPADPDLPPFDPDNPVPPNPPGFDYMPAWLTCILTQRKKVLKRWHR